jgi:ABC-type glycerol-3-phosphate transport system substrate-binding protein
MKKLFALFLVAGVLVAASCGSKKTDEGTENTENTVPTTDETMTTDTTGVSTDTTSMHQ